MKVLIQLKEMTNNLRSKNSVFPETDHLMYIFSISLNRRRTIAQIRCGCLPSELETGRYRNPKTPLSQRICHLCNTDAEDETHFLTIWNPTV